METQIHTLKYLDQEVDIVQYLCESDEQFNTRIELIKKIEKDNVPWKDAHKISKIFYNIKYKKSRYTPMVYNMIRKYL